jgi:phosphoribosylformimino-5-aminoimidazole carboxamide ribotide isomerase
MNVYPAMDLLGGRVVRLHKGDYDAVTVYADDPAATLARFADAGATRAHIVDLDGARSGAPLQAPLIRTLLRSAPIAVQVGGGIRSIDHAKGYLDAGADRVVLGTSAVSDPAWVERACGALPVVVAVDARDGWVAVAGWTETSGITAMDLARRAKAWGACAVLYTDVARDGTGAGPNVDATEALALAVPGVEVIASGGIGSLAHLAALAERKAIGACVVGRALYEGVFDVRDAIASGRG